MKFYLLVLTLIVTGCASRPPKLCYEMTITYNQGIDKQVICTTHPQQESHTMRRIN